jgi:tetratricopeptide (TPR) repeat protein
LGSLLITAGDTSAALSYCEDGLAIAHEAADSSLVCGFLGYMCIIRFRQGDHVSAEAFADEALASAYASQDDLLIDKALQDRASISIGSPDEVRADFAECLSIFRKARDYRGIIRCLHNLGYVELKGGNLEAARSNLEESLSMAKEFHDNYAAASCLSNLTRVAFFQQDFATAQQYVVDSLIAARRANLRGLLPQNVLFAALCASANGDQERAATLHGGADSLIAGIGESFEIGLREPDHARLRHQMGNGAFEIAYGAGLIMTDKEVFDLALG